jgi:hypothetical protein
MQCLIDADVLRYEIGFAAETGWQHAGFPPFDYVAELLDNRIGNINAIASQAVPESMIAEPILYLTGSTNFRFDIAKRTPYKQRAGNKPWHFKNITAYLKAKYDVRVSEGMEADDLMSIEQTSRPHETIICTRDKDLFGFSGWKYSWELGNQAQRGPMLVDSFGDIRISEDNKKLTGEGEKFFYAQLIMGDPVDSIPGIPKAGPKTAFDSLCNISCREDAYNQVLGMYRELFPNSYEEELLEQARLLHMIKRTNGSEILMWNPPNVNYEDWYDINTREIKRVFNV